MVGRLIALTLAVFGGIAASQDAEPPAEAAAVRIVSPTASDLPAGDTRIEATVDGARPGDVLDFFVDGRKVGTASAPPWVVTWPAGEDLRPHAISAVLVRQGREIAAGRTRTRDAGFTATADVRAVSLAPIVTDKRGDYIFGLTRHDFVVSDDGVRQQVETFDAMDSPLSAILVLDTSASMRSKLEDATRAARTFVDALQTDDEVGLLTFNSAVVGTVDPTLNRAKVRAAIDSAQPAGETALYDAVAASLRRLKTVKGRKAVILLTDGEDNRSRLSVGQVIEMARSTEVAIYAIAQGEDESKALTVFLERIASQTGGRSYFIGNMRKLGETFAGIVKELRSQYFMTYTPRPPGKPGTWHQIEVRVSRADATVRAKKEYQVE
jgi:Ca-activated chloride channel family protein